MSGLTLDSGALIGAERGNKRVIALLDRADSLRIAIAIPAGVLARVWRADPRQHRLHMLLLADNVEVVVLDRSEALRVGALLSRSGDADVVDVSVVVCARQRSQGVVTSDVRDIAAIDDSLRIIPV